MTITDDLHIWAARVVTKPVVALELAGVLEQAASEIDRLTSAASLAENVLRRCSYQVKDPDVLRDIAEARAALPERKPS